MVLALFAALVWSAPVRPDAAAPASRGERLYRDGILPSGSRLQAQRDGAALSGGSAACVNCHRRSGLGSYEGKVLVPPISGRYLFGDPGANALDLDMAHVPGYAPRSYRYTADSLGVALRSGVAPDGRTLGVVMPRYSIDPESMAVLVDYLNRLSVVAVPGVGPRQLEFATVVTPDADPLERDAMLEVLEQFVRLRNAAIDARVQDRPGAAGADYRVARRWRLRVWKPVGPPATWERQLERFHAGDPVFAVLSGIGGAVWSPVHRFCESRHVPCLFPNVDLPVVAERDFYPLYLSRGALLEADLIRARLETEAAAAPGDAPAHVIQVYRSDDVGAAAAAAFAAAARPRFDVIDRRLPPRSKPALRDAIDSVRRGDVLILWLRGADIAALGPKVPPVHVYVSGSMAGLEQAPLNPVWRDAARMAYPYDTPQRRGVRENFLQAWLHQHGMADDADRVRSNTYLACSLLADTIDGMRDSFVPDYLVERLEGMLSGRANSGYFPRLGLAPGQRFASKGGFIVRFNGAGLNLVQPDGDWIIP